MTHSPTDPADAFAELGRIKLAETSLDDVLQRVAELAKRVLPVPVEVSVTLVRGGTGHTAAFTHELALDLDERQYAQGSGPCLAAAAGGDILSVPDITAEDRWPDWAERGRKAGVGSSVSIGMPIQEAVVGALNVYARTPHAFDDDTVAVLETFAAYAAVALANAQLYESTANLARQMQDAMASRAVIEQAKGIIMAERRCTATEAFNILAKVSQDSNRKLRDVAQALVDGAAGETRR
ncbi:GAF and ANTAR domain-containing protein [Micromonospora vinacea]|uniref:GAF domain-containing protein n=1 Tax=Micromonospora vinacea TaxID=709878 RepID=A0ABS0KAJ3_9ACTN|nr:GAF and ANTAR domain-containing protein [Micromonospora vinacea]MBG6105659.1 GAF domain-containing protein [Micromonospora vinacea]WSZ78181.1 GAF and ANTAR domain-containing protein [Micromonospora sp. NBC_00860]WTA65395.1 GAF and ANTAR domain-containing protein [Micromonospora sp. NBC_00855]